MGNTKVRRYRIQKYRNNFVLTIVQKNGSPEIIQE